MPIIHFRESGRGTIRGESDGYLQNAVEVGPGDDLTGDDDDEGAPPVAPDVRPGLPEPPDEPAPFVRLRLPRPRSGEPRVSQSSPSSLAAPPVTFW